MARAPATVEPAFTVERAGGSHDLETHCRARSTHAGGRETDQLTQGHVLAPVARVAISSPRFAVADGELDLAGVIRWIDQPLSVGRDGVLCGKRRGGDCKNASDEEDGEPHNDSRDGFDNLDRQVGPKVAAGATSVAQNPRTAATAGRSLPPRAGAAPPLFAGSSA